MPASNEGRRVTISAGRRRLRSRRARRLRTSTCASSSATPGARSARRTPAPRARAARDGTDLSLLESGISPERFLVTVNDTTRKPAGLAAGRQLGRAIIARVIKRETCGCSNAWAWMPPSPRAAPPYLLCPYIEGAMPASSPCSGWRGPIFEVGVPDRFPCAPDPGSSRHAIASSVRSCARAARSFRGTDVLEAGDRLLVFSTRAAAAHVRTSSTRAADRNALSIVVHLIACCSGLSAGCCSRGRRALWYGETAMRAVCGGSLAAFALGQGMRMAGGAAAERGAARIRPWRACRRGRVMLLMALWPPSLHVGGLGFVMRCSRRGRG